MGPETLFLHFLVQALFALAHFLCPPTGYEQACRLTGATATALAGATGVEKPGLLPLQPAEEAGTAGRGDAQTC